MKEKIKKFLKKFFLINDTPHKIAAGAALGIFLGIMPGEGVLTTLVMTSLFGFNRMAATAGVVAFNWWMMVMVLPVSAAVGGFFFQISKTELIANFQRSYHLGYKYFLSKAILLDVALPLVVGFFLVAGTIAIAFYFLFWYLLTYHKIRFIK